MSDAWIDRFPGLSGLEPATAERLFAATSLVQLPAGQVVFRDGDECGGYILVIDGVVRVQMTAETGREIVLYRVDAGESCILTTACLLAHERYAAEGVTETPVTAAVVPAATFREQLGASPALREFVFTTYGTRITALMMLVEEVAFGRVDVRLARFLCDHAAAGGLATTHQQLAVELGTAREVVSRQLKEFERRGCVRLTRGRVAITDLAALETLGRS